MRLTRVGKRYGRGRWALVDVDVTVPGGTVVAFRGGNGSGKSMSLRTILVGGPAAPLRTLSKGNAQKVALAQALLAPSAADEEVGSRCRAGRGPFDVLVTTSARKDTAMTTTTLPATESTTSPVAAGKLPAAALGTTRIVVSFLFGCHGLVGLTGAFGGVDGQGGTVEALSWPGWWASVLHLVAGPLVMAGLFTRTAALLCSGAMAYAYFVVHQPIALFPIPNGGEPAALYSWIFLLIAALGPGAFAVDTIRRNRREPVRPAS